MYFISSGDILATDNVVAGSKSHGIYVTTSTNVTFIGGSVKNSGQPISGATRKGFYFTGSSSSLIEAVEVAANSDIGIYLVEGTEGVRVKRVTSHHNARQYERIASGMESRSNGNIFESSIGYANEDSGMNFRWGGSNGKVFNCIAYNNGDHGVDVLESPGVRVVGNSVHKNVTAGINVEGNSPNAIIINNISMNNGIASPRTEGNIRVTNTSMPTTADYNIVWQSNLADRLYQWAGVYYKTLKFLQKDFPGVETHGVQADPKWNLPSDLAAAPGSDGFELTGGSPAIDSADSATNNLFVETQKDAKNRTRCNDVATPDTGGDPRTYDDRGALERSTNCSVPLP